VLALSSGEGFHRDTQLKPPFPVPPQVPPPPETMGPTRCATSLPEPLPMELSVGAVLKNRRSRRHFGPDSLSLAEVATLLWATGGVSHRSPVGALRTIPSAGALYPLELYCFAERVHGLPPGLYHYVPAGHTLELVGEAPSSDELAGSALGQSAVRDAPFTVAATAVFGRCSARYGDRGYRYVYQEAGHMSQNFYLAAESLGLKTVVIGAFYDRMLNGLLGIDGTQEAALWLHPVGR
jgi:SagB-type dehydrogenase family enzyme